MAVPSLDTTRITTLIDPLTQTGRTGTVVTVGATVGTLTDSNFAGYSSSINLYNKANLAPNIQFTAANDFQATYPAYGGKRFSFAPIDATQGIFYFLYNSNLNVSFANDPSYNPSGPQQTALSAGLFSSETDFARYRLWDGITLFPADLNTGLNTWGADDTLNWRAMIIAPGATPIQSAGTLDATSITALEYQVCANPGSGAGNRVAIVDAVLFIKCCAAIGGTASNPATFLKIIELMRLSPYFAWIGYERGFQLGIFAPIGIGDGSTPTVMIVRDQSLLIEDADPSDGSELVSTYQIAENVLGIRINLSASCLVDVRRVQIASSLTRYHFFVEGSQSADFTWQAGSISNVGANSLGGASRFESVSFSRCDRLALGPQASIRNCLIADSTDVLGAVAYTGSQDVSGVSFRDNLTGLNLGPTINAIGLNGNTFEGNTHDFRVEATGTVTITVDANSTTDHPGGFADPGYVAAKVQIINGASVTFSVPALTLRFTNIPNGAEGRIRQGSRSLYYEANITSGQLTYDYDNPGEIISYIFVLPGFQIQTGTLTLGNTSQDIALEFSPDPSYLVE